MDEPTLLETLLVALGLMALGGVATWGGLWFYAWLGSEAVTGAHDEIAGTSAACPACGRATGRTRVGALFARLVRKHH